MRSGDFEPSEAGSQPLRTPPSTRPRIRSFLLTALSACVIAGFAALLIPASSNRLELWPSPERERALALIVDRSMDLEEALRHAPIWERRLYDALESTASEEEVAQLIAWYQELVPHSPDPVVSLRLAILEAEVGRWDDVRRELVVWADGKAPFPAFARLLRAAYETNDAASADDVKALKTLAPVLGAGWSYDRLAVRIFRRVGDSARAAAQEHELPARAERLLCWSRIGFGLDLLILVVGGGVAIDVLRRRPPLNVSRAMLPSPWRGRDGLAVLLRGTALGILLMLGAQCIGITLDANETLLNWTIYPLLACPVLFLARRWLIPADIGFSQVFGLKPDAGASRRLMLVVLVGFGLGAMGEWSILLAGSWLDLPSHWTEWFDDELAWGNGWYVSSSLLQSVVMAPLVEELLCRGLLFGTLRRRFGWVVSALISAAIFASAHGYGAVGWMATFCSGAIWAWLYERTRSLVPGMLVHGLSNLLASYGVLLLRAP